MDISTIYSVEERWSAYSSRKLSTQELLMRFLTISHVLSQTAEVLLDEFQLGRHEAVGAEVRPIQC